MIKFFTKRLNNKKGFTLIELIVVIAILGILAAIAVPRFLKVTDDAREKTDVASAKTMESAVRIFEAQGTEMPTVTDKSTFEAGFKEVLPEGVPTPQKTDNEFWYNTATYSVQAASTNPGTNWVQISPTTP